MDLLKSAISFAVVTILAYTVLADFEDRREISRAKQLAHLQLRQETLPAFISAAVAYETAARTAYVELYQWEGKSPTKPMADFEQTYYPQLLSGMESIRQAFQGKTKLQNALSGYEEAVDSMFLVYDKVRDERLDGKHNIKIEPWNNRSAFDEAREAVKQKRNEVITIVNQLLYPSE